MLKLRLRQGLRHVVQFIAACAFILGVSPCACMLRDLIIGCEKINADNVLAFRALVIIATVIAFTLLFGRSFCSWICPLGSLQELAAWPSTCLAGRLGVRSLSLIRYLAAIIALTFVVFGFLVARPDTFIFIEMAMVFWVMALFMIILFDVSDPAHEPKLKSLRYASLGLITLVYLVGIYTGGPSCVMFRNSLDYSSIIAALGVVVASLIVGRAWCKFLCPEGALLGLLSRASHWRVAKEGECKGCGTCHGSCPMNAVEGGRVEQTSCILCGKCVERCPSRTLKYQQTEPAPESLTGSEGIPLRGLER